jgi:hypothetical protein
MAGAAPFQTNWKRSLLKDGLASDPSTRLETVGKVSPPETWTEMRTVRWPTRVGRASGVVHRGTGRAMPNCHPYRRPRP